MPAYELSVVMRKLARPDLVSGMGRVGKVLYEHGALLRKVEFLGHRRLPSQTLKEEVLHDKGSYFIVTVGRLGTS